MLIAITDPRAVHTREQVRAELEKILKIEDEAEKTTAVTDLASRLTTDGALEVIETSADEDDTLQDVAQLVSDKWPVFTE